MKFAFTLITLIVLFLNRINCMSSNPIMTDQILKIDTIQLNEELESNLLVLNLTDLLINKLNLIKQNSKLIRLESIKFDQSNLNEYFSIDLKKFLSQDQATTDTLNQSSIILLKTSSKKLDREYICRLDILDNECSCEHECLLNLNLISYFIFDNENDKPETFGLKLKIPILLNDINDNKPFFYQPEIMIDLDQIDSKNENDLVKIPLKLATDLDSKSINRVQKYELVKIGKSNETYTTLKHDLDESEKLHLLIDFSRMKTKNLNYKTEKFKLIAYDRDYQAKQDIILKFRPRVKKENVNEVDMSNNDELNHQQNQQQQSGRNAQASNLINVISGLNELEIHFNNQSDLYEIRLKENIQLKSQVVSNKSDSLITLGYLIIEKNKLLKFSSNMSTKNDELIQLIQEQDFNLFHLNEMRNGLYSISIKSYHYDLLKKSLNNNLKFDYKLKLTTKFNNITIVKYLNLKIPSDLVDNLKMSNTSVMIQMNQTSSSMDPFPISTSNLNFYNSVIIISTASAVLVVFGFTCFILSIIFYLINKCRKNSKKINKKNILNEQNEKKSTKIMVYDVLPNGQKQLPIYTTGSSSSSSSTCSSSGTNSNSLSPVTTTTTSVINDNISNPGPLFDTHLHTTNNYDWYIQNNKADSLTPNSSSPLSASSSANLIKAVDNNNQVYTIMNEATSNDTSLLSKPFSTNDNESSFTQMNKYRSDLYRNSQILYKKQINLNQQIVQQSSISECTNNQSNYYSLLNGTSSQQNNIVSGINETASRVVNLIQNDIYQAKPVNLINLNNMNQSRSITSSPSYSLINEMQLNPNLNSTDSLRDSIKEKMINRLSASLANSSNKQLILDTSNSNQNSTNTSTSTSNTNNHGQISCV